MRTRSWKGIVLSTCLAIASGGSSLAAAAGPDLKWDLSYQSALRTHPIGEDEFLSVWPSHFPKRPIHKLMAAYKGEPIVASVLLEGPDSHTGDPVANWFIQTRTSAKVCTVYKRADRPCDPLDLQRAKAFMREVAALKLPRPLRADKEAPRKIGSDQRPVNYLRFLSVYMNGRSMQRPVATIELAEDIVVDDERQAEVGRLVKAMSRLVLSDEEFQSRQAQMTRNLRETAFIKAIQRGDIDKIRSALRKGGDIVYADTERMPPIAIAASSGQQASVDFFLKQGAWIDAGKGAALKAAVRAHQAGMVAYLLSRGARVEPPLDPQDAAGGRRETPLSIAVRQGDLPTAQLLFKHGASLNPPGAHPPIHAAALALDLPMLDWLRGQGVTIAESLDGTPPPESLLMMLMGRSGWLGHPPEDEDKRRQTAETEAQLAQVVRSVVAAGASVNHLGPACRTAYEEARFRNSEAMMRLLLELGADPQLTKQCLAARKARPGA